MSRINTLLNEKNHYLEKFYALNEVELINFAQGKFDNIEGFYQSREGILEVLQYIDAEIDKAYTNEMPSSEEMTAQERKEANEAMRVKDEYVARIIEQDIQVLSCIESAKNSIIRELQEVRSGRKAVRGYKSNTFEHLVNEEV